MPSYQDLLFPRLAKLKIPFTRDQLMLLMAAVNEIFLGIDIYLAHMLSGTIVPREWIPIIFGPAAGVVLLVVAVVGVNKNRLTYAVANLVFLSSILVGLLGAYYHFVRAILPTGPAGSRITIQMLIWAPPVIGPLIFSLVGLLGFTALWQEDPPNSGRLILFGKTAVQFPFSKIRAYFMMVSLGTLATLLSSVLDHARTDYQNPWLWIPAVAGVLGVLAPFILALLPRPRRGDLAIHFLVMGLLILVGILGAGLHVLENLTSKGQFVAERFYRGAPFLAPLLFANMGALGLICLVGSGQEESGAGTATGSQLPPAR